MEQKMKRNSKESTNTTKVKKKSKEYGKSTRNMKSKRFKKEKEKEKEKDKDKDKKTKKLKKTSKSPQKKERKKEKQQKKGAEKSRSKKEDSSSSSSDEDDETDPFSSFDGKKQLYLAGKIKKRKKDPEDYVLRLLNTERPDLFPTGCFLDQKEAKILDEYLKEKGELRSGEIVVMKESEEDDEKKQKKIKIINKFNEGRFGAIYAVNRIDAVEDKVVFAGNEIMFMKTSLRQSACSTNRLIREITVLKILMSFHGKEKPQCKRIVPLLHESKVLGIPYFLMPQMGTDLEKLRIDFGLQTPPACSFFIAQEILMGIKDMHCRKLIHRDIKPSNILVHTVNRTQWWLIDFGDTVESNQRVALSPPDAYTLPYLSLTGHIAANPANSSIVPANYNQDIESWFYILMDLFKPLNWKNMTEEEDIVQAKKEFWNKSNMTNDYPVQIQSIKTLIERGVNYPYKELSEVMKEGFEKFKTPDWRPCWIPPEVAVPTPTNPAKPVAQK